MDSLIVRGLDLAVPPGSRHLEASHSSLLASLRAWQSADNVPSGSQGARSVLPTRVQTDTSAVEDKTIPEDGRASGANNDLNAGLRTSDPDIPRRQSAAEILSTFVSKSSVLQRLIGQRVSKVWLIDSDEDTFLSDIEDKDDTARLRRRLQKYRSRMAAGSVLLIEDLNTKTCEALGLEYPDLDRTFLIEHMLRFDKPPEIASLEGLQRHLPISERSTTSHFINSDTEMETYFPLGPLSPAQDERSFHLDLANRTRSVHFDMVNKTWNDSPQAASLNALETMLDDRESPGTRRHLFAKSIDGTWKRSNTRISCCHLTQTSGRWF